ncbi:MAG: YegS/Rv2252/BmrU family lipid kinase [Actinobacteria bacterium]|nr:YegS/Rv2252/BmrU family lipid kinase [Actinomycetota bacterium]NCA26020.1 YegS/Rv2252/BmrU family lipid kinase [Actinomycetota bacterium]NCU96861.1 YegS/Rv2252/BmrU family lipid kinase [Actinomycetota bacterium]NCZ76931.1 YegS/Rv2252/BmrU family lipid kinase [Actinomycetota bacterium]
MWLLVVNPKAGKGKSNYLSPKLEELLKSNKLPYEVINKSTYEETMFDFHQRIKSGNFERVIAIGGDGLVNLCLQEIAESDMALAVVPAGTGNDFARAVGAYKKSVEEIFNAIRSQDPTAIDLGLVTGDFGRRWYVQVLSTGFDALVNNLANKITWPKGQIKYTLATIFTLARFKPIKYELIIDDKKFNQNLMLLSVANGETYGGGMRICPNASNSDGIFDILLVHPVSKIVLLTIFPKVFAGKHIPHPRIEIFHGKEVKILADATAFADGEFISKLPIEIKNVQNALKTWLL